jgi:hypothetical protein
MVITKSTQHFDSLLQGSEALFLHVYMVFTDSKTITTNKELQLDTAVLWRIH